MPEEVSGKVLSFEIEHAGRSVVVKCHGRLVAGTTEEFYHQLKPLIPGSKQLVVDMEQLVYVDSMGVGTLMRLYLACRNVDCEMKLTHLGKQVRNVLALTNILAVFGSIEGHNILIG